MTSHESCLHRAHKTESTTRSGAGAIHFHRTQGYVDANNFIGLFDFLLHETMRLDNAQGRAAMLDPSTHEGHPTAKHHDVGRLDGSVEHRCQRSPQRQSHERCVQTMRAKEIDIEWWKNGFIYVEKLSKRCCINFRLLYK